MKLNYYIVGNSSTNLMPNDKKRARILLLIDETRLKRQLWIKSTGNPEIVTLYDILEIFPRFSDFNKELKYF